MHHLPILVDVDGVCSDFVGLCLDYINNRFNVAHKREEVYTDIRKVFRQYWDTKTEQFVCSDGFAQMMAPLPGALEGVEKIREMNRKVLFVTSPYGSNVNHMSATWCRDRFEWLKKNFKISRDDVVFAREKEHVFGAVLIDDLLSNVTKWKFNMDMYIPDVDFHGLVFSQPWNERDYSKSCGMHTDQEAFMRTYPRPSGWTDVVEYLRKHVA